VTGSRVEGRLVAEIDRQALLTMLTTEHFGLAGSRAATIAESSSRAALYMGTVSSTLIALGFIAQVSENAFDLFALAVLPSLYTLGVFTFVREVESSAEDILYGRAINRIRAYYLEQAGTESRWFMMSGHDDTRGVLANMGLAATPRQLLFTVATMVATVNSVVGGTGVALLVGNLFGTSEAVAAAIGALAAMASFLLHRRWDAALHRQVAIDEEPLFPSPE
jgi:hypothetical protein